MSITQLARHSIVYGLGHILSRFITFLLLPILTSSLSTMDFGAISKFYAFTGFAMAFYRYGMDTALMKFYIENNNDQSYFSSIFFLQILSSLLFSFFLYLFSHYLSTWIFGFYNFKYMIYMISIIFSDIVWNLNAITLRAEKKPVSYIVLNLINVSTILILTIIYVNHLSMGIGGVLFANLFGSVLTLFFSLYILFRRFSFNAINFSLLMPILKFGIPFLPAALFSMILESADRFMLSYYMGDHYVGVYSASYKLGIFGLLVVMAFNMGWTPYFLEHGRKNGAHTIFSAIQTLFLGFLGFLGVLLTIFIPIIIHWDWLGYSLIGAEFVDGIIILPWILMSYYFFGLYVLLLPKIYIFEKTHLIPIVRGGGAALNILLNIMLIPACGIVGAAIANLLAYMLMSLGLFVITNKLKSTSYNFMGLIFPLIMWFAVIYFNNYIFSLFILGLYPALWYKIVLNNFEKEKLKEFFV